MVVHHRDAGDGSVQHGSGPRLAGLMSWAPSDGATPHRRLGRRRWKRGLRQRRRRLHSCGIRATRDVADEDTQQQHDDNQAAVRMLRATDTEIHSRTNRLCELERRHDCVRRSNDSRRGGSRMTRKAVRRASHQQTLDIARDMACGRRHERFGVASRPRRGPTTLAKSKLARGFGPTVAARRRSPPGGTGLKHAQPLYRGDGRGCRRRGHRHHQLFE